ncbi:DNA-protecting protein DprA [Candidatus Falkowbacteria bacterium]|uniref:DNA-protecting protein DprA n=1 Tax=Candidatus Falkowbacteria bacterium CG10_big_fil_rev_8_21_14_0_10_37_18 TaxID=1974562 RepID=A0A2H0V8N7_9BACT|nr:DNA-protecting protein DprA [Candidatus Falkowbacteria bacterium]NCQ13026.1 DNA-protecting protein DprA [Candidatus Falkowbacteria bacterium]OIO05653.1 MAG: DNA protecting protein DprA [Candidatus Falkowbacteria bacterium CG1_02_37_21]PIR95466.1 MAG: DNA-protecting protein DprA [Candidatus Falkowbacteria bacterium CG10_big_fil_rev_8_21_14_0_10_37_18]
MINSINSKERDAYLSFNNFQKIGPMGLRKLENYFSDLATAWQAKITDLIKTGLPLNVIEEFIVWRKSFSLEKSKEELTAKNIKFISIKDNNYPPLLKEISAAPPLLYYQGALHTTTDTKRLAVVGSRQHSAYAEKIITELLPNIIKQNIEIVSGLALGVDSLAHQTTLKSQGITLAVLGSGLNNIYPRENLKLAENIINSGGVIISEFPPDTPPYKTNFPRRNRLISGLTEATLVIEAKRKSGALITATYALEQNREVLAVPGSIFSEFSAGPNHLIKEGARPVSELSDILQVFNIENQNDNNKKLTTKKELPDLNDSSEKIIYQLIKQATERTEKISADEINKISKLDTTIINSKLSILELREIIINDGFGYSLK